MKRIQRFVFLVICLIAGETSFAQIPYYDALKLDKTVIGGQVILSDNAANHTILEQYAIKTTSSATDIKLEFATNPFFKIAGGAMAAEKFSKISSLFSSIGNLDVTNIADGFAKFLVKRAREELNVAFFSKFYELIKKEEYKDARTLFPQTYAALSAIGDQIYNYQAFINGLKESFEKDLNGLLDNLPKVINDGRYSAFFTAHPPLKAICLSAIYIGKGFINKEHPGKIIADYDVSLLDKVNPDVKAGVQSFQLFSESLRSAGTDHYWIDTDSLKLLIGDPVTLQVYFGLLYQQAKTEQIKFSAGNLWDIMAANLLPAAAKLENYNQFIKGFIKQASVVASNVKNIAGKKRDELNFTDYYDFYNSALDIVEYGTQVADLPGLKGALVINDKFQNCIQIARTGGNLALDINRKNFGSAVLNVYTIYSFAFGGTDEALKDVVSENGADATAAKTLLDDRKDKLKGRTEGVKKFLLKYGSFMSSMAQAEKSDDVESAIEAAALPSGSSRIKRETPFNVALNAYIGPFGGMEYFPKLKKNKSAFTAGVTAPIGVAFSWGGIRSQTTRNGKDVGGKSITLFVPLVDIGALASFRFANDSSDVSSTIKLKNIIAPGLYFYYGLGKCPISIGAGAQIGPQLREVTAKDINVNKNFYIRYGLSITVDIPIINFYTKTD